MQNTGGEDGGEVKEESPSQLQGGSDRAAEDSEATVPPTQEVTLYLRNKENSS